MIVYILVTSSILNLYFQIFNFSILQGETYEVAIYKNGNSTKDMLHINIVLINNIYLLFFELFSQANK